jgi:prephenate dehydrogenase
MSRFNHIAVVGVGLIGGSFALAAKRAGICARVTGWGGNNSLARAVESGVIDGVEAAFDRGRVSNADLIYLAAPVGAIIDFLKTKGGLVKRGAIVTDAGSTKREICRAARAALGSGTHFIGGHPMAGSHSAGVEFARADLFYGAPYAIITDDRSDLTEKGGAFDKVVELVKALGARPLFLTARRHDFEVARVSHVPQILSTALAVAAQNAMGEEGLALAGSGFADMTRLAASQWSMWRDILLTNSDQVVAALFEVLNEIEALRSAIDARDFASAQEAFRHANSLLGKIEKIKQTSI